MTTTAEFKTMLGLYTLISISEEEIDKRSKTPTMKRLMKFRWRGAVVKWSNS